MTRPTLLLVIIGLCAFVQFLLLAAVGSRADTMAVFVIGTHSVGALLGTWLFICKELSLWRFVGVLGATAICLAMDEALGFQGSLTFFAVPIVTQAGTTFILFSLTHCVLNVFGIPLNGWSQGCADNRNGSPSMRSGDYHDLRKNVAPFTAALPPMGVALLLIIAIGLATAFSRHDLIFPFLSWEVVPLCVSTAAVSSIAIYLSRLHRYLAGVVAIVVSGLSIALLCHFGYEWEFIIVFLAVTALWTGGFLAVVHILHLRNSVEHGETHDSGGDAESGGPGGSGEESR
jgi:hypothetical protein